MGKTGIIKVPHFADIKQHICMVNSREFPLILDCLGR